MNLKNWTFIPSWIWASKKDRSSSWVTLTLQPRDDGFLSPGLQGTGGLNLLPDPLGGKVTIPPLSSEDVMSSHVAPTTYSKSNQGSNDTDNLLGWASPTPLMTEALVSEQWLGETLALHPALFQTWHHSHPTEYSVQDWIASAEHQEWTRRIKMNLRRWGRKPRLWWRKWTRCRKDFF